MPERTYVDRRDGETKNLPGGVLRRPFALKACERKAYREAKNLYKNSCLSVEQEQRRPHDTGTGLDEPQREFKHRMVDSIKKQEPM